LTTAYCLLLILNQQGLRSRLRSKILSVLQTRLLQRFLVADLLGLSVRKLICRSLKLDVNDSAIIKEFAEIFIYFQSYLRRIRLLGSEYEKNKSTNLV